jgi:hypothetical protein
LSEDYPTGYKYSVKEAVERVKQGNESDDETGDEFEDLLSGRAQAEDAGANAAQHHLNQLLRTPEDELDELKLKEANVGLDRELRKMRARVRRLQRENRIESKFEPLTIQFKTVPYSLAITRAFKRAGGRAVKMATESRADKLRRKYGIKPKKSKEQQLVLRLE